VIAGVGEPGTDREGACDLREEAGSRRFRRLQVGAADLERNILMSLAADHVFAMEGTVTDKEIEASYNEHAGEMVRNGKKIPLSAVKEQIRESLQNDKRNKALDAHISN